LRTEAPVWKDPITGMWQLTRYDDVRMAAQDTERFSNRVGSKMSEVEDIVVPDDPVQASALRESVAADTKIRAMYEERGWVPINGLQGTDEPDHWQRRRLFDYAFRPKRVADLDPFLRDLANRLIDGFIDAGACEFIADYAVPLPLYAIGRQLGVPEEDMPRVKQWTDAFMQRMGLNQTPEQRIWSAEQEIEFQNYFHPLVEGIRARPDDSLFSDLVNKEMPGLGRTLTDQEVMTELMDDLFVAGSETTQKAIASGMLIAINYPEVWAEVVADPERNLSTFLEEVLRIESPVVCLLRLTTVDIELHGTVIPAGSVVALRYAAANHDDSRYPDSGCPHLGRQKARGHLAFGVGSHHCVGSELARREMYWAFRTVAERLDDLRLTPGRNDFACHPNYFVRGYKQLHVEFSARKA
jgi:cytochrome P450